MESTSMFEGIRHISSGYGLTNASYCADEVIGFISFQATSNRACVISSIGPDAAVRRCAMSHHLSSFRNRWKARVGEDVVDIS